MFVIAAFVVHQGRIGSIRPQREQQPDQDQLAADILTHIGRQHVSLVFLLPERLSGELIGKGAEQQDRFLSESGYPVPDLVYSLYRVIVVIQYGVTISGHFFMCFRTYWPSRLYHRGRTSYSFWYQAWIS